MAKSEPEKAVPRSAGRPRSEETRRLILQSTLDLLRLETLSSITVEAIARQAGVSKATIYRWWNSKALIVVDAFVEHHIVRTPLRRDLCPREAIAQHMRDLVEQYSGFGGQLVGQIIAEGRSDETIAREFRSRFHYGRRAVVREVLEEWRLTGDIAPQTNTEMLMDLLYGPIYMRLMLGHAPLDERFVEDLQVYVFELLDAAKACAIDPAPDASQSGGG
ncbi:AcrR family transcriptional regulator [Novosphingobium chloroacetimidivorans]|uniref:AcrR family transcriptional regulator n=1 Tax=Novosphingobium chloroacetimidivorans TaxID=1428314 RepID=A0A7W7KAM4_9SPHN|nr:TetR/AcrR family transcriptional regulator [Novosphingobium chloroacetimidivorans]MBB4858658.1 AcrR family transcriptional regulator [Novosphingobium chloroacetimidivorans]